MQLAQNLRQMLALLETERQALAGLDVERMLVCSDGKQDLCAALERLEISSLDEECKGLLNAVRRLNDINRRLRNVIAANVQARLTALTGRVRPYERHSGSGAELLLR